MESFLDLVEAMEGESSGEKESTILLKQEPQDIVSFNTNKTSGTEAANTPSAFYDHHQPVYKTKDEGNHCGNMENGIYNPGKGSSADGDKTENSKERRIKGDMSNGKDIGSQHKFEANAVTVQRHTGDRNSQGESFIQNHRHSIERTGVNTYESLISHCPRFFTSLNRSSFKNYRIQQNLGNVQKSTNSDQRRSAKNNVCESLRSGTDLTDSSYPRRCLQCHIDARNAGAVAQYCRRHNPNRPFGCDQCPSRFNQLVHLQIHQRTHTGEKPFLCYICGARFSRKDRLRSHQRIHTGEKPYSCPHCDHYFRDTVSLKEHLKSHQAEKTNICRICRASFVNLTTFTTHWRMHKSGEHK